MKKKIIAATAALSVFMSCTAFAAAPKVVLDNRTIDFDDQEPVILENEGRTLVPLRSVFEHMGATVEWYEKDRSIAVISKDGFTKIILQIDNNDMIIRTFSNLIAYTDKTVPLDAAPRIMNDRTMVPLRVISEALDCDVAWDDASYTISINTKKDNASQQGGETVADKRIKMSISADKTDVKAGDEVKVYVNAENFGDRQMIFSAITARIFYDNTKFELVDCNPVVEDQSKQIIGGSNEKYRNNSVKAAFVIADSSQLLKDGALCVFTFKALTDEGGEFSLSNAVSSTRGNDTCIDVKDKDGKNDTIESDSELIIDTTPLKIN